MITLKYTSISSKQWHISRLLTSYFQLALSVILLVVTVMFGGRAKGQSTDDIDIGSPQKAGSTSYATSFSLTGTTSSTQGIYTVLGGGSDIAGTSDQFHFNRGPLTGNGTVSAQVTSISNTNVWAKSGVMLRNDVTAGSAYAAIYITPGEGVSFQWRASAGKSYSYVQKTGVAAPVWLKLYRSANSVSGYYSTNGSTWTQVGSASTVTLGNVALAGVAVCAHNNSALCASTLTTFLATPDSDSRYLHASGSKIVNASGATVNLRGANLGGWLVTEGWMNGDANSNVDREAVEVLESRFGVAQAGVLMNAWYDNWIAAKDLDNIQSYGFTVVRVPFSWRNLQDESGNWVLNSQGAIDFSRFDWLVQEAAKRNLYVILDLHVWNGYEADNGAICQSGALGQTETNEAAALWSQLAAHFKGNGTVAAFDLINEPTGSNNFYQAHRAFYSAIRAQDPNRLVIAEWVGASDIPALGWTNFMLSSHYSDEDLPSFDSYLNFILTNNYCCALALPYFEGEFKPADAESPGLQQNATDTTVQMDQLNWAWTSWCYKAVNVGGWALNNYDNSVNYNTATDSYSTMQTIFTSVLAQWRTAGQTNNLSAYTAYIAGLSAGATYVNPTHLAVAAPSIRAIINSAGGLAADDAGGSTAQNAQMVQSIISGGASQNWVVNYLSNGDWAFINSASGLALGSTSASNAAIQSSWTNAPSQQWTLAANADGSYRLSNVANGLLFADPNSSTTPGTALVLQSQTGGTQQNWTFRNMMPIISYGVYELVPECAPGAALEVAGSSTAPGGNVDIGGWSSGANQSWRAIGDGNGFFEFAPIDAQGMRMEVYGGATADYSNVDQWNANGGTNQKWKLYPNVDGSYSLEPQNAPGLRLNVYGGSNTNGTNVDILTGNGGVSQAWTIYPQ